MARTLIIKDADFEDNKVDTVSWGGDIPQEYVYEDLVRTNSITLSITNALDGAKEAVDTSNRCALIYFDRDLLNRKYPVVSDSESGISDTLFGIPLPNNLSKIKISGFNNLRCIAYVFNTQDKSPTLRTSQLLTQVLKIDYSYVSERTFDFDATKGGDTIIVWLQTSGSNIANADLSNFKISFE